MYMSVLPTGMPVYHMCGRCPRRSEEDVRSPGSCVGARLSIAVNDSEGDAERYGSHSSNLSAWEAEAGGSEFRGARATIVKSSL